MRNSMLGSALVVSLSLFFSVLARTENFCQDLQDWGPAYDRRVNVSLCRSVLEKDCKPQTKQMCMEVTEVDCEVELFSNCTMDGQSVQGKDYIFVMRNQTLKNCQKMLKNISHEKTLHRCENITKKQCTTLWRVDDKGERVWAGTEDDCRDVTWEECKEHKVNVTIPAPAMNCTDTFQSYLDYEKTAVTLMADSLKCEVEKKSVCKPVKKTKCGELSYTECEEKPKDVCEDMEILIPTQEVVHKQWCLFDENNATDFKDVVQKIPGNTLTFPLGEYDKRENTQSSVGPKAEKSRSLRRKRRRSGFANLINKQRTG